MQEPWIERLIREAQEAGKLDVTKGAGEPITGLNAPYDPAWWAKRLVRTERQRQEAAELGREIDSELPRLLAGCVMSDIRAGLESLNAKIQAHNARSPGNALSLLDVEQLMKERTSRG
jgi:hypothetical protein